MTQERRREGDGGEQREVREHRDDAYHGRCAVLAGSNVQQVTTADPMHVGGKPSFTYHQPTGATVGPNVMSDSDVSRESRLESTDARSERMRSASPSGMFHAGALAGRALGAPPQCVH